MTMEELAFRSKVRLRTLQRIETGVHQPRAETAKRLARVLKCSFGAIYGEDPQAEAV